MLIFIAGYPGPAAIWTTHMVRDLCAARGPAEIIFSGTQAELTGALVRTHAEWSVIHMPHPGNRMIAALRESGLSLVLVQDDPRHNLMVFLHQWKTPMPDAIRAIASGAAAAQDLAKTPGALHIEARAVLAPPNEILADLKNHLGVHDLESPIPECPPALPQAWQTLWQALSPEDRLLAEGALAAFFEEKTTCTIHWGAALFKGGPLLETPLLGPLDITGRARILLQGPFINLPEGLWQATVRLGVSEAAVQNELLLEGQTGQNLVTLRIRPDRPGEHIVNFDFKIDSATDSPFFLRLSTTRASFDGEVLFHETKLKPLQAGSAEQQRQRQSANK